MTSRGSVQIGRLSAIAVALAVAVGSIVLPSADAAPAQELRWGPCPAIHDASPAARCATVQVPLDHAMPSGPTIDIMISRLPARDPGRRRGVLIGNPGGPGSDAIGMFSRLPVPDEMRDEWDLVGVQPRGLLSSTPLTCTPVSDSQQLALLTEGGALHRRRCAASTPAYLRTITTENTARDIEVVRRVLGVSKVSLYGISYGTLLMSTYATLFPRHTDRLVLDSAVNPALVWNGIPGSQTQAFKSRMNEMLVWIAKHDNIYHLGRTPLAVYRQWSAKIVAESGVPPSLAAPPAQVGDVPPGLRAVAQQYLAGVNLTAEARARVENLIATLTVPGMQSNSLLLSITRIAAPDRNKWAFVAMRINGRAQPKAEPDPEVVAILTSLQDLQSVIMCNENQMPAQPHQVPASVFLNGVVADVFDGPGLYYQSGMACAGAPAVTTPVAVTNNHLAVQPLQLQARDDPQTPYRESLAMHRLMGSHLITVGGGDHAQLGRSHPPLDRAIVEYLRTGTTTVTEVPEPPITASLTTPPTTGIGRL
ncbi:alpha/beta fold hydrolase [Gordonia sp. NPDC062954]|uniref:alpha/beta fold hydrolase n=1 Tax=Gordonia sp. NPDC062954 TaxID=3364003 RepID=UPI0037C55E9F